MDLLGIHWLKVMTVWYEQKFAEVCHLSDIQ